MRSTNVYCQLSTDNVIEKHTQRLQMRTCETNPQRSPAAGNFLSSVCGPGQTSHCTDLPKHPAEHKYTDKERGNINSVSNPTPRFVKATSECLPGEALVQSGSWSILDCWCKQLKKRNWQQIYTFKQLQNCAHLHIMCCHNEEQSVQYVWSLVQTRLTMPPASSLCAKLSSAKQKPRPISVNEQRSPYHTPCPLLKTKQKTSLFHPQCSFKRVIVDCWPGLVWWPVDTVRRVSRKRGYSSQTIQSNVQMCKLVSIPDIFSLPCHC